MDLFPLILSSASVVISAIAWTIAYLSGAHYFLMRGRWMEPDANMRLMGLSGAVAPLFGFLAVAVAAVARL